MITVRRFSSSLQLPYKINRTTSGNLPVYSKVLYGNKSITVVRKLKGSEKAFEMDIRELLEPLTRRELEVKILRGRVEIKGSHKDTVVNWLEKLGF